ncbi:hypothetical protein RM190_05005 [Paracoccus sp. CPCC 101403]|uniref:Uncharacterized protein n=1 Tax=Paracoccus broussonetiae TaxID=3075834 RepID=A0ABU3EAF5_9RHOB|nr:hypothetical protein [Paracoccus sp. CPCC 101403]MDT1061208.1 hypothetical protein [Paracoccus sp. CPCC 101403]
MLPIILAAATCVATPDAYEQLSEKLHRDRALVGLSQSGAILEIWTGPEGSWTALLTRPDGLSCVVDAGQGATVVVPGEPV